MATTETINLNIAGNAQQQLSRIQKQVDTLGKSFSGLRNILGGLAIGALVTNMLRSADAMDDLAKATGFTISEINGLGAALAANGGEAQDAEGAITKFSNSLADARNGSSSLQDAFYKLGIPLRDLAKDDKLVFRETIKKLGEMPASAQRTALIMELLGKNVRSVDFTGVNEGLDGFVAKSKEAEPGIKNAADLFDNLRAIGRETTNELFANTSSLSGSLKDLTSNTKEIAVTLSNLINLLLIFGTALGALRLVSVINQFTGMVKAMKEGGKTVALLGSGLKNLRTAFEQFLYVFSGGLIKLKNFTGGALVLIDAFANLGRFALRFGSIAGLLYGIGEALKLMGLGFNPIQKIFSFLADVAIVVVAELKGEIMSLWESWTYLTNGIVDAAAPVAGAIYTMFQGPIDWTIGKLKQLSGWWEKVVSDSKKALGMGQDEKGGVGRPGGGRGSPDTGDLQALIDANEQLKKKIAETTQAYAQQNNQIQENLVNELKYIKVSDDEAEVLKAQDDIRNRSNETIAKLIDIKEGLKGKELELIPIIDAQIASIKLQEQAQLDAVSNNIKALQDYKREQDNVRQSIAATIETLKASSQIEDLQEQLTLIGLQDDELERQQTLIAANAEMRDTLITLAEKMANVELTRAKMGEEAYQREKEIIQNQINDAYRLRDAKIQAKEDELAKTQALEESYAEGAKRGLKQIADQYVPINMAQEAIKKGWDAIGNAVDTFVETGKLKFSDFARSVLQDLAKMIIKAQIFKAISGIAGAFGLSIPGLAEGGKTKSGKPYIVGEKGPELFVPQTAGTIVPNNKLGQSMQNAGGPVNAPITNNYITNNISAVDAKSVAQLFAENRKTLLGSVKMAEREMPYMAR